MSERIVILQPEHVPQVMRLNLQANWNQVEADWIRLLEIEPTGCFGLETDGAIVASTTAVCYGRTLAWIGMVLTDAAYRGRGYARRLMEHALEYVERRGVRWIKLDATDMGRPLYTKLGFEDETPIERWQFAGARPSAVPAPEFRLDLELDRAAFGADRAPLLQKLSGSGAASLEGAFAMGRPGLHAGFFGPCVAQTPEAARTLLQWFLGRNESPKVCWDLLPENREALRMAGDFGFERHRQLVRMVRPGVSPREPFVHHNASLFAMAGFEYG
jgi:GNAT superfamily N-acetyltransferase